MSYRHIYRNMRHYERESRRLTRLAAANEYSRHADDRMASEYQEADADIYDDLARECRKELGL